jgi:aminoglycoside phosphotransferase (APT) family kinase protein
MERLYQRLAVDLSFLGAPIGPMVRVHGGFTNRMYRLDTDQGSFAVKELSGRPYRAEDVFRFERAAFAAGIPMPEPISAGHGTLVHRWVEGEKVPEAPVSPAYAFEIGEILARIHGLDVAWSDVSAKEAEEAEDPASRDWPELAERAAATGQPWAGELASQVETLLAIAHFVDTCPRPGPVVLTHRDIQPWNLFSRAGRPVVLDWELSGMLDLSGELGSTALSLAKGPGFDDIEPAVFRSVLDGYVAGRGGRGGGGRGGGGRGGGGGGGGGALPPPGPSWFVFMLGGWLGHMRWNLLGCLAGAEARTGPELALSHESVRNGVRGLPVLFGHLTDLQDLLW